MAINDTGQIVFDVNADNSAWLLTPTSIVLPRVPVTITSMPPGVPFVSGGSSYTTPHTFSWAPGSTHTVTFPATLNQSGATRYGFTAWGDDVITNIREILVRDTATICTANYSTQHKLQWSANPSIGGVVVASPSSVDGFYNANTGVRLTAVPNSAYQFTGFSGDLTGSSNGQTVFMTSPRNVIANYAYVENPVIQARIANNVSKAAQPGPAVTVNLRFNNIGSGIAKDLSITGLSARVLAPAPAQLAVSKETPILVGTLPPGASSGTVSIPLEIPPTARRTLLYVNGTVRNSADRAFTFTTSVTILR
jgi:hypothetical protein